MKSICPAVALVMMTESTDSEEHLSSSSSSDDDREYRQEKTECVAKYLIPPYPDGKKIMIQLTYLTGSRQPLHRGKQK